MQEPRIGWKQLAPTERSYELSVAAGELLRGINFSNERVSIVNTDPRITSTPAPGLVAGEAYTYMPTISELDGDSLTFDLPLAPVGMAINPENGTIHWTPRLSQVGSQNVLLRVRDGRGGFDLQYFTITVAKPNTAPIITSTPPAGPAGVGLPLVYDVNAIDADGDSLTFTLSSAPIGATIGAATGIIQWTPTLGQLGTQSFTVSVNDGRGSTAEQAFVSAVQINPANTDPIFLSEPPVEVRLGDVYLYRPEVLDANGDPLDISLAAAPAGMLLVDNLISWTPGPNQLGNQTVRIQANDGRGGIVSQEYTIRVSTQPINNPPTITSVPITSAVANIAYRFLPTANDPDSDNLFWSLEEGPVGMSMDPVTGRVDWLPTIDDLGPHVVTIQVIDTHGSGVQRTFTLTVRAVNAPPVILSIPRTDAAVGATYLYQVTAQDVDQDRLTFSLANAPGGMTIDANTGRIVWTPSAGQAGSQNVSVIVRDSAGATVAQTYSIAVAAGQPNQLPVITSSAKFYATVDAVYGYDVDAIDPDGDTITYALLNSPAGMNINADSGLITWTPGSVLVDPVLVEVLAQDQSGGGSLQGFGIRVQEANNAPAISSAPPTNLSPGQPFRYDILATDPDGDFLTYELITGPEGMLLDGIGRMFWIPSADQIGSNAVEVRVTDTRGASATQAFSVTVAADTTAPQVAILLSRNPVNVGTQVDIRVSAIDNVGVDSIVLTVGGVPVPLDSKGVARVQMSTVGSVTAVALVTDAAGNSTAEQVSILVSDPNDVEGPTLLIISPSEGGTITAPTDVTGSVTDDTLVSYRLLLAEFGSSNFNVIGSGTQNVNNGVLGQIDPTLLQNGSYVLRLEAFDAGGRGNVVEQTVEITGQLKLGNFRLSFTDLVIPVAGIPVQITRTYDSLRADRDNGVGYGWQLDYRDADLRVGVPATGLEEIGIYSPLRPGVKVYLTLPGQERLSWTFDPNVRVLPGLGGNLALASPRFTPDAGNRATLSAGSGQLFVNEFNELYASGGIPWNPASPDFGGGYRVTTQDGLTYFINGLTGKIDSITDANGNRLVLSDAGVSGSGVSIDFERNQAGRITAVVDPNGDRIEYEYNQVGDLILVRDRNGNETTYKYDSPQAHFLTEVVDALGNSGIRGEYDDSGRIISLTDANGNPLSITTNINSSTQIIVDALGNQTLVGMDNQGNINYQRDAKGNETFRTFDSRNNLVTETNALGETTRYTYDNFDNVLTETHPDGGVTRYTYSNARRRLVASVTSASGRTTTNTYDNAGNVLATRGDVVNVTAYTYDSRGNVITVSESGVSIQSNVYDTKGNLIRSEDAAGNVELYAYDAVGNEISSSRIKVSSSGNETFTSTFRYDKNSNLVEEIDALGGVTKYEYDANGQQIAVVDALGRRTEFVYDTGGLLVATIFPDATPSALDNPRELKEYDAGGRLIAEIDRKGRRTEFNYDAVGNLVEIVFPDETPETDSDNPRTSQEFDRLNRSIAYTDERGNRTTFEYDSEGNLVAVTDALGNATRYEYDIDGQLTILRNPLGQEERYEYDDLGRVVKKIFADGTSTTSEFDARGMRTGAVDQLGHRTNYVYDDLRLLTSVIDASGAITGYEYDSFGQVIVQRDGNGNETRYEYDALGRQTRTVRPLGQAASVAYDAVGNVVSQTDYAGQTIEFSYDQSNRLVLKELPGGVAVSYVYDIAGKLLSIEDTRGTTTYTYDARDRLVEQINPDGTFLRYGYDLKGNRISLETPSGETTYDFDALDRLRSVRDRSGNQTVYSYDAVGQLILTERANGTQEVRAYDAVGNLVSMTNLAGLSAFATAQYSYNAKGFPVRAVDANGRIVEYAYDRNDRLISESIFDPLSGSKLVTYSYDLVGNRLVRNDSVDGVTNYTYDANDRLLSESTTVSATTYTYDDSGNTLTKSINGVLRASYGRDSEGRLVAVDSDGNGTTDLTYEYDDFGNQVERSQDGNTQYFLVDANLQFAQIVEEYTASGIDAYYVYGLERISQERGAEKHYYVGDRLGSTVALTNSAGLVTDTYLYDAFGQTIEVTGDSINAFRFTGEFRDVATGLDYLRARHLNTSTGRFMTTDPYQGNSQQPVTLHRYIYANASPTRFVDPTGRLSGVLETLQTIAVAVTIPFAVGFGVSISTTIITKGKINWGDVERAARAGVLTAAAANGVPLPLIAIASGLNELELIHWGRAVTGNDVATQILLQLATFGISLGADAVGKQLTQQTRGLISSDALLFADALDKMIGEFTGQQSSFKALLEAFSQGNKSLETVVWAKHKTSAGRLHRGEFS